MDGSDPTATLLDAMARLSGEYDATAERDLVRALADATLLVPLRQEPDGTEGLWASADRDGRTEVIAFTDEAALQAWLGRPGPHALVPGVELAGVAASADAVALWVNPAGPHGGRLDRRMVDVVAAGRTMSLEVDDGQTLRLRTTGVGEFHVRALDPAPEAAALERLRAALAGAGVRGAWLLEATAPPPAHPLIVVWLAPEADADAALGAVRDAAAGLVPPDRFVDIAPVVDGDGEMAARAREVGLELAP